jgi:hypothetical protein
LRRGGTRPARASKSQPVEAQNALEVDDEHPIYGSRQLQNVGKRRDVFALRKPVPQKRF